MIFTGRYLRVLSPRTVDGNRIMLENDRVVYREDHLPYSALRHLQVRNSRLPDHLKKKIEVVETESIPARAVASTLSEAPKKKPVRKNETN